MIDNYEVFDNAEEVWFWYCACLLSRGDGLRARCDYQGKRRPCEIGDIEHIIKKMHQFSKVSNRHLRVMYRWGGLFYPPYYDRSAKKSEIRLWEEGLGVFEAYLRSKGFITDKRS